MSTTKSRIRTEFWPMAARDRSSDEGVTASLEVQTDESDKGRVEIHTFVVDGVEQVTRQLHGLVAAQVHAHGMSREREIHRDGDMLVGRYRHRVYRSWRGHAWTTLRCVVLGHDFGPFRLDDYEGACGTTGDGASYPLCPRESRPDEYGLRTCRRSCGAAETRWPIEQAPQSWRESAGV